MQAAIIKTGRQDEFFTTEGCFIRELWNRPEDGAVSVARARVAPGVTTAWHRLRESGERYLILSGTGVAEVGSLAPAPVAAGDVIVIPPGIPQRIANTGTEDLVFLCVCTPRFIPENYEDMQTNPATNNCLGE